MSQNRFIVSPKPKGRSSVSTDTLTIIILASAPIYRMRTYGPTPLIRVDNECLFDIILERVGLIFPSSDIILTVGFQAQKVIKYVPSFIRIVENQLYEDTNLTEDLRLALNNTVTNRVLIINGNCVLDTESFTKINLNESSIFVENKGILPENAVGVTQQNGFVNNFAYGIENKWCEIAYITNKELELLKNVVNNTDRKRFFLFESLNVVLEKMGKIKVIEPNDIHFTKVDAPYENLDK